MNIRLFSVVLAAVGSLALAACTVTTTDGTGGAGGGGGDTSTSTSSSTASAGGAGGTGSGGAGGTGGGSGACKPCGVAITDLDIGNLCQGMGSDPPSQATYDALQACACDATTGMCLNECGGGGMCVLYDSAEMQACLDCLNGPCMSEFQACANEL
jgi:hypothetical protein